MLRALAEAGDQWAPQRLRMLAWNRRDIEAEGLDCISRLRVRGYAREVARLTAATPEVLHPGTFRGPAGA